MKNKLKNNLNDDLQPEYDLAELFKKGQRGKYSSRYHMGTNVVLLDSDVAKAFPNAEKVNDALRLVLQLTQIPSPKKARTSQL